MTVNTVPGIGRMKRRHGFPRKLVPTFAKNSTERLVEIVKALRSSGLVVEANVAIQTTDPATLEVVKRKNISTDRYRDLMSRFRSLDIPFNTDLMVNLPGQTPESFRRDLQYFADLDVTVQIWPTLALPNSALSDPEFRRENALEVDERGRVVACRSFTREERNEMMRLRSTWLMAENLSYLRYVSRFLQWDHGVPAATFVDDLQKALRDTPEAFPDFATAFVFEPETVAVAHVPESGAFRGASRSRLDEFYAAVGRFVVGRYGIPEDTALATALRANRAVIPDPSRTYPLEVALPHDFAAWYRERGARPLTGFGPGVLTVTDPEGRTRDEGGALTQNTIREQTWELPSDLWSTPAVLGAQPKTLPSSPRRSSALALRGNRAHTGPSMSTNPSLPQDERSLGETRSGSPAGPLA